MYCVKNVTSLKLRLLQIIEEFFYESQNKKNIRPIDSPNPLYKSYTIKNDKILLLFYLLFLF